MFRTIGPGTGWGQRDYAFTAPNPFRVRIRMPALATHTWEKATSAGWQTGVGSGGPGSAARGCVRPFGQTLFFPALTGYSPAQPPRATVSPSAGAFAK